MFSTRNISLNLTTILITFVILLISPILLLIFGIFYIYRCILFHVIPWISESEKFGKMLTAQSTYLAVDDFLGIPRNTQLLYFKFGGPNPNPDLDQFISEFEEKILNLKKSNGDLRYPELRQVPVSIYGGYFWKNIKNFALQDHIHFWPMVEGQLVDSKGYNWILARILHQPYKSGIPPWCIYFIQNVLNSEGQRSTAILLKVHHCLADGFSGMKMILKFLERQDVQKNMPKFEKPKPGVKAILRSIFILPFEIVKCLLIASVFGSSWDKICPQIDLHEKKLSIWETPHFPISSLKIVAKSHGVGVSSVSLGLITGCLRNFLLENNFEIPANFYCYIVVPVPGHPDGKLRNQWTLCLLKLPLDLADPVERLAKIQKRLTRLKSSTLPISFYMCTRAIGIFPTKIIKIFKSLSKKIPCGYSGIMGPKEKLYYKGETACSDTNFLVGGTSFNLSTIFTSLSNNGYIQFTTVDFGHLPDSKNKKISDYITQELDILLKISD